MPPQPRHQATVDIDEAIRVSQRELELWRRVHDLAPEVPIFSGGVHDCWPARAVEALRICRLETQIISTYQRHARSR